MDWLSLGQRHPRSIRLTPEARSKLAHLTELRDVFSPSDAVRVGAEFAGEEWLARDLLAVRPWLPQNTPKREVVSAILNSQWTGFLALLGEYGPWVYVPDVAQLQQLSRLYAALVAAASQASEEQAFASASLSSAFPSLITRLEQTDYRQPVNQNHDLVAFELAFWHAAQANAKSSFEAWRARRY